MLDGLCGVFRRKCSWETSSVSLHMLGSHGASLLEEYRTKNKCWFDSSGMITWIMPVACPAEFHGFRKFDTHMITVKRHGTSYHVLGHPHGVCNALHPRHVLDDSLSSRHFPRENTPVDRPTPNTGIWCGARNGWQPFGCWHCCRVYVWRCATSLALHFGESVPCSQCWMQSVWWSETLVFESLIECISTNFTSSMLLFGSGSQSSTIMHAHVGHVLNAANPRDLHTVKHSWGRRELKQFAASEGPLSRGFGRSTRLASKEPQAWNLERLESWKIQHQSKPKQP